MHAARTPQTLHHRDKPVIISQQRYSTTDMSHAGYLLQLIVFEKPSKQLLSAGMDVCRVTR